jgi:MoaA/NifB/PqqE/SkfB family radical SAM enzyme
MENTGFPEITEERLCFKGPGFWFCEIAITGLCNFRCEYCNRIDSRIDFDRVCEFIDDQKGTLRHIQLTGGEPALYTKLPELCRFIKERGVRLGISTNGSAEYEYYDSLGADMFSISLDDCDEELLLRRGYRNVPRIRDNIRRLSERRYVNVGLVIDTANCQRIEEVIAHILSLGAWDVKLSVSTKDDVMPVFGSDDYSAYPILNYRVQRFRRGMKMRGIGRSENFKCALVRNDIAIVGNEHYPCLVYAREGGSPIGALGPSAEADRRAWSERHRPSVDPICSRYCMDFKCEYNACAAQIGYEHA